MDIKDEKELNAIKTEQRFSDDKERAKEMLTVWLDRKPDASWNDLLNALKLSHIGLNTIALKIKRLLLSQSMFVVTVNNVTSLWMH